MTRSTMRRIAVMKGEPAPQFEGGKMKLSAIHLIYENVLGNTVDQDILLREKTKWLFIALGENGYKKISLSGDDVNDAYLLRILENAVVRTMDETNRMVKR